MILCEILLIINLHNLTLMKKDIWFSLYHFYVKDDHFLLKYDEEKINP